MLITISGNTGSGKDTVADYLAIHNFKRLHPIEDMKAFLESHYSLPVGYLDTRKGKADSSPTSGYTYQEVMVKLFHFFKEVDPNFSTYHIKKQLKSYFSNNLNVCAIAIRNMAEVMAVRETVTKYSNPWIHLHLIRSGYLAESSDNYDQILISIGKETQIKVVKNNGSLEELYQQINQLLEGYNVTGQIQAGL